MKASLHLINKKGQAAAELAIMGILIITAFAYIMNFGQSLGAQQQTKMESFRRALQKSYIRNASTSYTLKKTVNIASPNAGFFQGQGLAPEASSSVTWQKGRAGDPGSINQTSFAFWQINDKNVAAAHDTEGLSGDLSGYGLPLRAQYTYGADGSKSDNEMLVPASMYKDNAERTETYAFSGNKQESNADIKYEKTARVDDAISGDIYTHFNTAVDETPGDDEPVMPNYEPAATIPYSDTTVYTYDSDWTVPHDTGVGTGSVVAGKEATVTSIEEWDAMFPGRNVEGIRNQIGGSVYNCVSSGYSFVVNDWVNGGGSCNMG